MQMPPMMPRNTLEPKVALSLAGADSAVYLTKCYNNTVKEGRDVHGARDQLATHAEALGKRWVSQRLLPVFSLGFVGGFGFIFRGARLPAGLC
jgi:hypothetical protein